ncbi:hypothetical protein PsalN5692_03560 (plasmid) [Piscirickettsia salmonis]|uniref:hypothetical protein n=1 Tax=Piscirickettsia salmonis TaxID=1238 RepID=UPI001E645DDB|nr:hypothetical protein [Piscirickettsia salmonis]QGP52052.1 hypothetical protein PsalN5692_03560 [Piscirickettsia salmonis]
MNDVIAQGLKMGQKVEVDKLKKRAKAAEDKIKGENIEQKSNEKNTASPVKRDAFTFPVEDYNLIYDIMDKVEKDVSGVRQINKSEIVRAGLRALIKLDDKKFSQVFKELPRVKSGRK